MSAETLQQQVGRGEQQTQGWVQDAAWPAQAPCSCAGDQHLPAPASSDDPGCILSEGLQPSPPSLPSHYSYHYYLRLASAPLPALPAHPLPPPSQTPHHTATTLHPIALAFSCKAHRPPPSCTPHHPPSCTPHHPLPCTLLHPPAHPTPPCTPHQEEESGGGWPVHGPQSSQSLPRSHSTRREVPGSDPALLPSSHTPLCACDHMCATAMHQELEGRVLK